jgi:hypothetical protein
MGDWYDADEDFVVPYTDVTTLTDRQLMQAMYDVDDERKDLSRYVRRRQGGVWTKDDDEQMESMNKWAKMVWDEILKRGEEERKNLKSAASEKEEARLTDKESLSSTSNQSKQDEQHRQGRREGEQDGKACGAEEQVQSAHGC